MDQLFPIIVADPQDAAYVLVIESREQAERGGELEVFDVMDENFLLWNSSGAVLRGRVREGQADWLELTPTGECDAEGVWRAIERYAEAVGCPWAGLSSLDPVAAVRHIESFEQRADEERREQRRWYQFWRRD